MSRLVAALAIFLIALVAPLAAQAQTNPFVGSWRGIATVNGMAVTFNLVMQPNQTYSQQLQAGSMMTLQTGSYRVANGMIAFAVVDWQPKTQPVYHPTGTVGGYYTQQPMAKPPGGTFRYQFTSPTSVTLQDVSLGGIITFTRVQ